MLHGTRTDLDVLAGMSRVVTCQCEGTRREVAGLHDRSRHSLNRLADPFKHRPSTARPSQPSRTAASTVCSGQWSIESLQRWPVPNTRAGSQPDLLQLRCLPQKHAPTLDRPCEHVMQPQRCPKAAFVECFGENGSVLSKLSWSPRVWHENLSCTSPC